MKKAIVSTCFMLVFTISMFVGTSYAWWSEEIVVDENIIQMGNLDLKVELADPALWEMGEEEIWYDLEEFDTTGIFETRKVVEPGMWEDRYVRLTNEGTIPLAYRVKVDVDTTNPLHGWVTSIVELRRPGYNYLYNDGPITDLTTDFVVLQPGESHTFYVDYYIKTTLGDGDGSFGENLSLPFSISFEAQQVARAEELGNVIVLDYE